MPVPTRFDPILADLATGTKAGKVEWEPVVTRNAFATNVQGFTVSIAKGEFGVGIDAFELRVLKPTGETVDQFDVGGRENADERVVRLWAAITASDEARTTQELAPLAAGLRKLVAGNR